MLSFNGKYFALEKWHWILKCSSSYFYGDVIKSEILFLGETKGELKKQ